MPTLSLAELKSAYQAGCRLKAQPPAERLEQLSGPARDGLARLAILTTGLTRLGLEMLFSNSDRPGLAQDLDPWLAEGLAQGILELDPEDPTDEQAPLYFALQYETRKALLAGCSAAELRSFHRFADWFYEAQFVGLAASLELALPKWPDFQPHDPRLRRWLCGPTGLVHFLAHQPQHRDLHHSAVLAAVAWQEHLYQLGNLEESASLANAICFPLARLGQRRQAEAILNRIAAATTGRPNRTARFNLAGLLRQEGKTETALQFYRQLFREELSQRQYPALAGVLAEMAIIYRTQGHPLRAALLLEICELVLLWKADPHLLAVIHAQLAFTYPYLGLSFLSGPYAARAVKHFRQEGDPLSLGHALLTQGSIFCRGRQAGPAGACFAEALMIGQKTEYYHLICGALEGQAQVCFLNKDPARAEELLRQALARREQAGDPDIATDYKCLGAVYEMQGNLGTALAWYGKALAGFERYNLLEAGRTRRLIQQVEKRYKQQRQKARR